MHNSPVLVSHVALSPYHLSRQSMQPPPLPYTALLRSDAVGPGLVGALGVLGGQDALDVEGAVPLAAHVLDALPGQGEEIGRAHVSTAVTWPSRMPSSA